MLKTIYIAGNYSIFCDGKHHYKIDVQNRRFGKKDKCWCSKEELKKKQRM